MKLGIVVIALACSVGVANTYAQDREDREDRADRKLEPNPSPPRPGDITTDIERQAGTGSDIAFAEQGVVEVGGAGSFDSNSQGTILSLRPSVGWFIVDNLAVSAIGELNWAKPDGMDSVTGWGLYGEPSFHYPINDRILPFAGLGLGVAYNSEDFGFAARPRIGLDILLGRSGVFRPSFDLTWSTADIVTRGGETLVGVKSSFGVTLGYHVML
jgi:hypothetical protein